MILPQEARAKLKQYEVDDWQRIRHKAVSRLPADTRAIAFLHLGCDENGKPLQSNSTNFYYPDIDLLVRQIEATSQLDRLTASQRQPLFKALLPGIAAHLEAGWQLQGQMPYTTGYRRRAFHAPGRPYLAAKRRADLLYGLFHTIGQYDLDVIQLARLTPYLPMYGSSHIGELLAAVIDQHDETGNEVFEILCASARGEDDESAFGRHAVAALLAASRPEGWELIEQLLLAAQRQEGLRQVILESVDMAHPQAFRRMVQLIHQEMLVRFNSVVRAIDVWLGLGWDVTHMPAVRGTLAQLDHLLQNVDAVPAALASGDPQQLYLALWITAYEDADSALAAASPLLAHPQADVRLAATYLLGQLHLPEVNDVLLPRLLDDDLRVAAIALASLQFFENAALFEALETTIPRFPQKAKTLTVDFWPWMRIRAQRKDVIQKLPVTVPSDSLEPLLPYITSLSVNQRRFLVGKLEASHGQGDAAARHVLITLLADRSSYVRRNAIEALKKQRMTPDDAPELEALLTRKPGDLRRGVMALLYTQEPVARGDSIERLLTASNKRQKEAGAELLKRFYAEQPGDNHCVRLLDQFAPDFPEIAALTGEAAEEALLPETVSLENGLGLFDPAERTTPPPPTSKKSWLGRGIQLHSAAAAALVKSLDELIHDHASTPVILTYENGTEREELLGNLQYAFPVPVADRHGHVDVQQLPLRELWEAWWLQRPEEMRDKDGLEIVRALALPNHLEQRHYLLMSAGTWMRNVARAYWGDNLVDRKYRYLIDRVFWWMVYLHPPSGTVDFLLDAVEHSLTLLPKDTKELHRARRDQPWPIWVDLARRYARLREDDWTNQHHQRFWHLMRWLDEPVPGASRFLPPFEELWRAYKAGFATAADVFDHLIGPREEPSRYSSSGFTSLRQLSGRKMIRFSNPLLEDEGVQDFVAQCRQRIVEIETRRGEMATPATEPALALRYTGGLDTLMRSLDTLGKEDFLRGTSPNAQSKKATLSHLVRGTFPAEADTPERFAAAAKRIKLSEKRLIETAFYTPQWATHVEHALKWPALADAIWWFHAHTKDRLWQVAREVQDAWQSEISERTPLTGNELMDGAVDVAWFHRIYAALGEKRWTKLDAAVKYTSGGGGHTRARLFASAMLGQLDRETLLARIMKKRYQDAVRALGLLPPSEDDRQQDILSRYLLIQEFLGGSKKFGAQRQASEKLCAQIGMENLARTAGYADPLRLEWAMEREAVADLAAGPVSVTADNVTVSLEIDFLGEPQITVLKGERRLKNIPARLKKQPEIAALRQRKGDLRKQASRTRLSLENAMCRGDIFSGGELQDLLAHSILRPQLESLVFMGDDIMGYPLDGGQALLGIGGHVQALDPDTTLSLAHPYNLLLTGEWHLWQAECFRQERIQPFKQVFRELYVVTPAERETGDHSLRYAGHQVNPGQALALFGKRGWVHRHEEGIHKTFHDAGITAWVGAEGYFYTPAEVGGMTLERVTFTHRGDWKPLPLTEIPPRLFSEVMRDVDLVVSVAHLSGVDPEASISSIEMRANLVRETGAMLRLKNVEIQSRHVLIKGELNRYSVHLGSGVVHQQPGGYVCIVPVHSQHRGRVFLPFVDDDPKTAEIIAKVILLARDRKIKDPTILEQILPRAKAA